MTPSSRTSVGSNASASGASIRRTCARGSRSGRPSPRRSRRSTSSTHRARSGTHHCEGLSRKARPPAVQATPPRRRPRLPALAAVDDVRRDARAVADPEAHRDQAAVSRRLDAWARRVDRVPCGRLGRRRVHRELQRHGAGDLDARRQGRLAAEPAAEERVVARDLGRQARRAHDARTCLGPAALERQGALVEVRRLGDRVVADRPLRRRLLRCAQRAPLRARPPAAEVPLGARRELQDHVERGDHRRGAVHRRLLRPGARGAHARRADGSGRAA